MSQISHDEGTEAPATEPDTHIPVGQDNEEHISKLSNEEVEVFDDVSERNSVVKTSSRLSKGKSMSQLEMRSASKTSIKSQEGRRSSMSDVERRGSNLSRKEGRLSKISIQSVSRTSSHHDEHQGSPLVEALKEVEKEQDSASSKGVVTPPIQEVEEEEETVPPAEEKESDKQSEHKTQSPLGTVAPSRPGSQTTISIPTGSEVASSPTNEQPLLTNEQPPLTSEQLTPTNEQLPITSEQLPLSSEQLTPTNEQLPITNEQLTPTNEQLPITNEQPPSPSKEGSTSSKAPAESESPDQIGRGGMVHVCHRFTALGVFTHVIFTDSYTY